jgi:hypothetical protein
MTTSTYRRLLMLAFAIGLSACDGRSPSGPTPAGPVTSSPPSVTAIWPPTGSTIRPTPVQITGSGFLAGATVAIDAMAFRVTVVNSTLITAIAPARAAGPADVVVTNPGGAASTLVGAFTYSLEAFTLTPSTDLVNAGGEMSVSWTATGARAGDWIALYKVGRNYEDDWYGLTNGEAAGTRTLVAPTLPGEYEFRYLAGDTFLEVGRSTPVTVR